MKWRQKNGELIDLDDMSKEHLKNALKMMINLVKTNKKIEDILDDEEINFFSDKDN